VSNSTSPRLPAEEVVSAAVATADRQRRRRLIGGRLWRAAPVVAGCCLGVAVASRLAGWSAIIPLTVLAAGILGLALHAYLGRRVHAVSDTVAAGIDAAAGLGGELRSASWFAARETRDNWAELHIGRAARRLDSVDWTSIFPTVRAPGARIATAVMVIGALALALVLPERAGLHRTASAQVSSSTPTGEETPGTGEMLSPELQKQLEDLLAAAETGQLPAQDSADAAALRELLAELAKIRDPEALKKLARAMAGDRASESKLTIEEMKALAERAKRAAEMSALSPEARKAMDDLAQKLTDLAKNEQAANDQPGETTGSKDRQQGEATQTDAPGSLDELSIQAVKDASPGSGAGMIMISDQQGAASDAPGSGLGGGAGTGNGGGKMSGIQQALRQETVEASTDDPGENVFTDVRRKTEYSHATVTYTHGAAGTLDRGGAAAPPAVPEGRRAGLRTYFIRKQ
jgi:hypothetical protein